MKKGFTLVELSIVLVIIGLLISGMLAAQSMIQTAKIGKQVRQFQQFDVVINNFKTKFGALPGDSAKISPAIGNEDGIVTVPTPDVSQEYFYAFYEFAQFWAQLSSTNMLVDGHQYSANAAANYITIGHNIPRSPLNKNAGTLAYGITPNKKNYYSLISSTRDNYPIQGPILTPTQALALDNKFDDSNPLTGIFIARTWFGTIVQNSAVESSPSFRDCVNASGEYDVAGSDTGCVIRLEMLSQVGRN